MSSDQLVPPYPHTIITHDIIIILEIFRQKPTSLEVVADCVEVVEHVLVPCLFGYEVQSLLQQFKIFRSTHRHAVHYIYQYFNIQCINPGEQTHMAANFSVGVAGLSCRFTTASYSLRPPSLTAFTRVRLLHHFLLSNEKHNSLLRKQHAANREES